MSRFTEERRQHLLARREERILEEEARYDLEETMQGLAVMCVIAAGGFKLAKQGYESLRESIQNQKRINKENPQEGRIAGRAYRSLQESLRNQRRINKAKKSTRCE